MDAHLVLSRGFNDLVFEKRHKRYGAYEIRRRYSRNVVVAATIASTFFAFALVMYFVTAPKALAAVKPVVDGKFNITQIDIPQTPARPKIEPPKTPVQPKAPATLTQPLITDKPIVPVTHPSDSTGDPHAKPLTGVPVDGKPGVDTTKTYVDPIIPKTPRVWVPFPPAFDFAKFFKDHVVYPQLAKEQDIQGTIYLSFMIGEDGSVSEIKLLKGVHPLLNNEVLRVANMLPKVDPGRDEHHEPVSFIYQMPVKFTLQ